jgi:hypothetical protein
MKPSRQRLQLAAAIKAAYTECRQEWESFRAGEPVRYRPGKRYDGKPAVETADGLVLDGAAGSAWEKLADYFLAREEDPVAYIRFRFERLAPGAPPPEPLQLKGEKLLAEWRRVRERKGPEIAAALLAEANRAADAMTYYQRGMGHTPEESYARTLDDPLLELSALFRYGVATSLGGPRFLRIAARYRDAAVAQYCRYPEHYDRHWARLLPRGFARTARSRNR